MKRVISNMLYVLLGAVVVLLLIFAMEKEYLGSIAMVSVLEPLTSAESNGASNTASLMEDVIIPQQTVITVTSEHLCINAGDAVVLQKGESCVALSFESDIEEFELSDRLIVVIDGNKYICALMEGAAKDEIDIVQADESERLVASRNIENVGSLWIITDVEESESLQSQITVVESILASVVKTDSSDNIEVGEIVFPREQVKCVTQDFIEADDCFVTITTLTEGNRDNITRIYKENLAEGEWNAFYSNTIKDNETGYFPIKTFTDTMELSIFVKSVEQGSVILSNIKMK